MEVRYAISYSINTVTRSLYFMAVFQDLWNSIPEDPGYRPVTHCGEYSCCIAVVRYNHHLGYTPPAIAGCGAYCIVGPTTGICFSLIIPPV